ncbi:MAG TPA: phosphatase PAP2 family protein [Candidatus Paceibacterota bacterium]
MADFIIIFCAKYLLYISALALGVYWLRSPRINRLEFAAAAAAALALAYALARLAGLFFSHYQPFATQGFDPLIPHAVDNSFPSDHAALAGALAGVASLYNRGLGVLLWILAVAVAAGRMLAGLHYPVDVIVGLVLGGIAAAAAYWSIHLYFSTRSHT